MPPYLSPFIAAMLALLTVAGCEGSRVPTKIVFGEVTDAGTPVKRGQVRFVPADGTSGPASLGQIVDGRYRIEARGGIPLGFHHVEITVYGLAPARQDQPPPSTLEEAVARPASQGRPEPAAAAASRRVEVTETGDGRFDFDL